MTLDAITYEILQKQLRPAPLATHEGEEVAELEFKPQSAEITKPVAKKIANALDADGVKRYHDLARSVGFYIPEITIALLVRFLNEHDIPVFSLPEVIAYMDAKADKEGQVDWQKNKLGWGWRPLRDKDYIEATFGKLPAYIPHDRGHVWQPASDYYTPVISGRSERPKAYDKVVPIHALQKVALIEQEFGDLVKFFVSDYATPAWVNPDPFLMAVVLNPKLSNQGGRMVIDMWLEPGFGLEQMLRQS
jgi:hypothetical protein